MADFFAATSREAPGMEIVIQLESSSPPEGTVRCPDDESRVAFTGWLGLMRVLDETVAAQAAVSADDSRALGH